ncbi:MAG: hypothetical protein JWL97_4443 [Gemmatimonadales bacterium]|nr:hypothetical protein [Gemmatimonadales bacterium]
MSQVESWELRSRFAQRLASLYGQEVPAYITLVEASQEVNARVIDRLGPDAERLGTISRVSAERHGAIRVGTPEELSQVSRVFGALGMYPAGFYDLRDAAPQPVPVVSTAFRPIDSDELARNPFRVFTSMLVPQDRRFFDADLEERLGDFLARRRLFPDELLRLADRASADGGLPLEQAARFLDLAVGCFALSSEPVDRAWYAELERISGVAADIAGVASTHINHLTPRVLDIDELYAQMKSRDIEMIKEIQGPPRWRGPEVLLRQTSFRALAERRRFREPDGSISTGELRVRFGEVESRGIALTPRGRDLYDRLVASVDALLAKDPSLPRQQAAEQVWEQGFPDSERELARQDLAFFTYHVNPDRPRDGREPPPDLLGLIDGNWVVMKPIVYEDFLPRSAAGIFSSNLTGKGSVDSSQSHPDRDLGWLSEVVGRAIDVPEEIYAAQRDDSLRRVREALALHRDISISP